MEMSPRVQSSSTCTPKTTILIVNNHEFQTYEPIVCKAKIVVATCMKESKKGKGVEEKQTTLGNLGANASLNDQSVNIKINM
jgi:hypothetical protein